MPLVREMQPVREAARELRLERGDRRRIERPAVPGAACELRELAAGRARAPRPGCRSRTVPGKCSRHHGRLSAPSCAISGPQLSSSHHGASMPPANHEQAAGPGARGALQAARTSAPRRGELERAG